MNHTCRMQQQRLLRAFEQASTILLVLEIAENIGDLAIIRQLDIDPEQHLVVLQAINSSSRRCRGLKRQS